MSHLDDPNTITAALVIIGNEILSGRTKDSNAGWIAEKMTGHGVALAEVRVVPDIESRIVEAVNDLRARNNYVFTTGGIGPTHDDITARCVAKAVEQDLERNAEAMQVLLDYYGEEELTEARKKMSEMPVGATLIPNPVSGAPGFKIENVFVMAGVPRIMQAMLENVIADHIEEGVKVLSNTIACGLPESEVAAALGEIQNKHPQIDIGSYPNFRAGNRGLSVVLRGTDEVGIKAATEAVVDMIRDMGEEPAALGLQVSIDNF